MGTREAIRAEFMCVYARERLDRITVKALCAAVPVARTTFYAHYRNVDDVLAEVEGDLLDGLVQVAEKVSGGDLQHMDFSVFLNETFGYIRANWTDFRALLVIQPSMRFVTRWKDAIKANFARRYPKARAHQLWELLSEMAASATIGAFHEADWSRQRDMVQVNVIAMMQLTRLFVPHMVERGVGMVLNLSSVAAFSAGPYMSVYYATKAYVLSFSEALHEELAGTGVTVTALCPGPTATGFEASASMGSGSTMFRRAADPVDVARDGYAAMKKGKAVCLQGAFTKAMAFGSRLVPRAVARRIAMRMNR